MLRRRFDLLSGLLAAVVAVGCGSAAGRQSGEGTASHVHREAGGVRPTGALRKPREFPSHMASPGELSVAYLRAFERRDARAVCILVDLDYPECLTAFTEAFRREPQLRDVKILRLRRFGHSTARVTVVDRRVVPGHGVIEEKMSLSLKLHRGGWKVEAQAG